MNVLVFDIETIPQDEARLLALAHGRGFTLSIHQPRSGPCPQDGLQ